MRIQLPQVANNPARVHAFVTRQNRKAMPLQPKKNGTRTTRTCARLTVPLVATEESSIGPTLSATGATNIVSVMKKTLGFTLVEMMVAIAVLAIIATIAVPSFRALIEDGRVTSATNDLVSALQLARSEALMRRQNVTVCRAGGGACSNGTDWTAGWLVVRASDSSVIRVWDPPSSTLSLTGPTSGVTFQANGLADVAVNFAIQGPQCSGNEQRAVSVSTTGRVSSTRTACS